MAACNLEFIMINDDIEVYLTHLRAAGEASGTVYLRRRYLSRFAGSRRGRVLMATTEQIEDFLANPAWAGETRRCARSSLKGFYDWAFATGRRPDNPAAMLARVKPSPPMPRPTPRPAVAYALDAAGPRERLMVRLAVDAGLRRGEIAQVHESDVHPDLLGFSLLVHGKGGKLRLVPLLDDLAEQVMAACQAGSGHAFPGRIDGHLSAARVGELLTALLPPKITPHSFRHRFAANVYDETGDLLTVQTLLGHSSPETTRRYVPPNPNRLRAAVVAAAAA